MVDVIYVKLMGNLIEILFKLKEDGAFYRLEIWPENGKYEIYIEDPVVEFEKDKLRVKEIDGVVLDDVAKKLRACFMPLWRLSRALVKLAREVRG